MPYEVGIETSYVASAGDIGSMVRGRRITMELSQAELAQAAGVGRRFVIDLEAGKPSVQADALFKVCHAVDIELLGRRPIEKRRMLISDRFKGRPL